MIFENPHASLQVKHGVYCMHSITCFYLNVLHLNVLHLNVLHLNVLHLNVLHCWKYF